MEFYGGSLGSLFNLGTRSARRHCSGIHALAAKPRTASCRGLDSGGF